MKKIGLSLIALLAISSALNAGAYGNTYSTNYNYNEGAQTEIGAVVDVPEIVYEKDIEENDSSFFSSDGSGFYVGLAYSYTMIEQTVIIDDGFEDFFGNLDETGHGVSLLAGYDFNSYVGIEGRYLYLPGISSKINLVSDLGNVLDNGNPDDVDISNVAIYLKAAYPFSESFSVYGLVGYGVTSWEVDRNSYYSSFESEGGFQWGLGGKYNFSENIGIFIDYTSIYNQDDSGVNYVAWDVDSSLNNINIGISYKF